MNKEQISKRIEEVEKELASLRCELEKPEKFEWKYTFGETFRIRDTFIDESYDGSSKDLLKYGRYRKTKINAERALARNKRVNRLEALAEQIDVDYHGGYSVFQEISGRWNYYHSTALYNFNIMMKQKVAEKICELLNNGQFGLDGD